MGGILSRGASSKDQPALMAEEPMPFCKHLFKNEQHVQQVPLLLTIIYDDSRIFTTA
jgi:hypothetical protein